MGNKIALLVEDDPFIRRYLSLMLKECDFIVHEAATRAKAEKLAQDCYFDLAVIDGMLPDGSGVGLSDNLECKKIFVTGSSDQFNRAAMWKRGTLYQKPVDASFIDCIQGIYKE